MSSSPLDHPANAGLRRHLEPRHDGARIPPLATPDQVARPCESLGTHPDLVARLWDELAAALPVEARVVFLGAPALMHPTTGVVFGFAGGTHTYALRIPDHLRAEAQSLGASRIKHYPGGQPSFDLEVIGPEWLFCGWFEDEAAWCLSAFEAAGAIVSE